MSDRRRDDYAELPDPKYAAQNRENMARFAAWYQANTGWPLGDQARAWAPLVQPAERSILYPILEEIMDGLGDRQKLTMGPVRRAYWKEWYRQYPERATKKDMEKPWHHGTYKGCYSCAGTGLIWHVIYDGGETGSCTLTWPSPDYAGAYQRGMLRPHNGPCLCHSRYADSPQVWRDLSPHALTHQWQAWIRMEACLWLWVMQDPDAAWPTVRHGKREGQLVEAPWEAPNYGPPALSRWIADRIEAGDPMLTAAYPNRDQQGRPTTPCRAVMDEWAKYGLGPEKSPEKPAATPCNPAT